MNTFALLGEASDEENEENEENEEIIKIGNNVNHEENVSEIISNLLEDTVNV